MANTNPASILDVLTGQASEFAIGPVGSPSNTTEITIDILQSCESSKVLGQLVYFVVPQDGQQLAVIGQISRVETKNRWHEDLTFRGIIKRRGHLPHLSDHADVRTATISVQACFGVELGESEEVVESILGGTGRKYPNTLSSQWTACVSPLEGLGHCLVEVGDECQYLFSQFLYRLEA